MHAKLAFVKGDDHARHRVWFEPDDGPTFGITLHVAHDLPHLVVESVLGLRDGLWTALVADGVYPGATDGHFAAKALTNAIAAALRYSPTGQVTADDVRAQLASFSRPERANRRSYDAAAARRHEELIGKHVEAVDGAKVALIAHEMHRVVSLWSSTAVGDVMRLEWPLPTGTAS